jgi:hypothetical protein
MTNRERGGHPPEGAKPITGSKETMAMHAMSIDPDTGLPRGESPPASTAAVASLVCGVLLCMPLAGLPAIVAGLIGYRAARANPSSVGGAGLAVAGMVLGLFNLVLSALGRSTY